MWVLLCAATPIPTPLHFRGIQQLGSACTYVKTQTTVQMKTQSTLFFLIVVVFFFFAAPLSIQIFSLLYFYIHPLFSARRRMKYEKVCVRCNASTAHKKLRKEKNGRAYWHCITEN